MELTAAQWCSGSKRIGWKRLSDRQGNSLEKRRRRKRRRRRRRRPRGREDQGQGQERNQPVGSQAEVDPVSKG